MIPNTANYSSASTPSADSNTVNTIVVGPALSIIKSGPAGPLHPDQLVDFELAVENTGTGFASNLVIADTLSTGNLTYVPGSLTTSLNAGAFTALSDPADADAGSAINQRSHPSGEHPHPRRERRYRDDICGSRLALRSERDHIGCDQRPDAVERDVLDHGYGCDHFHLPDEWSAWYVARDRSPIHAIANSTAIAYAPIRAVTTLASVGTLATVTTTSAHGWLTGQTVAINGATNDPAFYNGSFAITVTGANTFTYTMSGDPANNAPAGTITADVPLAPGSTRRLRFQARVNIGTGGLFGSNQATVTANGQPITGSNLYQEPIVGNATVTGHVFLDTNNNGVQDVGEPDLPNVDVTVTDVNNVVQVVVTDSSGNYSATVPPGLTNLNVDNADPDIPPGSTPSPLPSTDPQNVTAVINTVTGSINVGSDRRRCRSPRRQAGREPPCRARL